MSGLLSLERRWHLARIRSIKPSFFLNDELHALGPYAALLFAGLWTQADREGRLRDRPVRLKAELLPYYECDIESLLDDLAGVGFIVRYENAGERFIQVSNFAQHQCPNVKEPASTIQAPCENSTSTPLIGKGMEQEGKGAATRAKPPIRWTDFPDCLSNDEWSRDGSPFLSSVAHIAAAVERKTCELMNTKQAGVLGAAMSSCCPEGCTAANPENCASALIDKIERANTIDKAAEFFVADRRQ